MIQISHSALQPLCGDCVASFFPLLLMNLLVYLHAFSLSINWSASSRRLCSVKEGIGRSIGNDSEKRSIFQLRSGLTGPSWRWQIIVAAKFSEIVAADYPVGEW